jgi:VanZ family protein
MSSAPFLLPHSYRPDNPLWSNAFKAWIPVLLCACVFAIESTATFGTDHTSGPLHSAYQAITGESGYANWSYVHHIIRKVGHFSGYGILSLVCFRGFWLTLRNSSTRMRRVLGSHGLAILATAFVASCDEIHQSFLPNRTGTFSDVVLDTTGATCLQLALFLVLCAVTLWSNRPTRMAQIQSLRRKRQAARASFQILGNGIAVLTHRGKNSVKNTWPTTIPTRPTAARWVARSWVSRSWPSRSWSTRSLSSMTTGSMSNNPR